MVTAHGCEVNMSDCTSFTLVASTERMIRERQFADGG